MKLKIKILMCPRSIAPHSYYLDEGTSVYPVGPQEGEWLTLTTIANPDHRIPSEDFFRVHKEAVE
jgi:hypothetical protein